MESSQFNRFDEIITEDCEFYADDTLVNGLEEIKGYFVNVMARVPDLRHEITAQILGVDSLAAEIVATGTMSVAPGVGPAAVAIKACDFLWFKDGRISRWHAYTDTVGLQRQLAEGSGSGSEIPP